MLGIYAIYGYLREIAGKEIITINESQLAVINQLFAGKKKGGFQRKASNGQL